MGGNHGLLKVCQCYSGFNGATLLPIQHHSVLSVCVRARARARMRSNTYIAIRLHTNIYSLVRCNLMYVPQTTNRIPRRHIAGYWIGEKRRG